MDNINSLISECCSNFSKTEEYRILKSYRSRDNRLTFDERFAINKSIELTYAPLFELLRADAPSLTESDLFFCALTFQHIETVAIAECLTVTKDAIRMRKLRLREKLSAHWFDLLFPEQKRNSSESVTSQISQGQSAPIPLQHQSTKNSKVMKEKMSFGKAVASCFRNYCNFNGRARRSEFWYWVLFRGTIVLSITVLNAILQSLNAYQDNKTIAFIMLLVFLVCELGLLLPFFAVYVRRLHDLDNPGWLVFVLFVIPELIKAVTDGINVLASEFSIGITSIDDKTMLLINLYFIITSVIWIVLLSKPGTEGPNQYGPDPIRIINSSDKQD